MLTLPFLKCKEHRPTSLRNTAAVAAYRAQKAREHSEWADSFERRAIGSRRIAGEGPICCHMFPNADPTLDNNVVQAEGAAACSAAQIALLAAVEAKK